MGPSQLFPRKPTPDWAGLGQFWNYFLGLLWMDLFRKWDNAVLFQRDGTSGPERWFFYHVLCVMLVYQCTFIHQRGCGITFQTIFCRMLLVKHNVQRQKSLRKDKSSKTSKILHCRNSQSLQYANSILHKFSKRRSAWKEPGLVLVEDGMPSTKGCIYKSFPSLSHWVRLILCI